MHRHMADSDWFRNKDWSAAIEQEFFAKLGRSRTQRDQYLVIQALTLAPTHANVALRLIDLYFSTKKSNFEDVRALSARATAYRSMKDLTQVFVAMKEILAIERERPQQKTTTYVDYPYLVASAGIESEYSGALEVLQERVGDLMFPIDVFKWRAAYSIIAFAQHNIEVAKHHAGVALDAAQIKKSGFRFHQSLGLVGNEYKTTVSNLRKIYA
jgi:hypothetical protein